MRTVNIHEAKTHLSRLVEKASAGEEIVIARAGKPVARLVPLGGPAREPRKLGLLAGRRRVPDDIDTMFVADIESMFHGPADAGSEPKTSAERA